MRRTLIALSSLILIVGGAVAWAIHPKGADTAQQPVQPVPARLPSQNTDLRVTFLGTSLSAALPDQTFADSITSCTGLGTTVSLVTKGGQTSVWGATQLARVIAQKPDIIFVEFTINDADLRRRVSPNASARAHRIIVDTLGAALPDTQIMLLRLNRAYGLPAALRPRQSRYDALLPRLAEETRAGYLDLRPSWSTAGRSALPDGVHPSPQAVAQITLPALRTLIAQLARGETTCP